jgi:serine/threonine protein phosphatase PrpC
VVLRKQGSDARGGRRVFAVCDGHGSLGHRVAEIAVCGTHPAAQEHDATQTHTSDPIRSYQAARQVY